MSTRTPDNHKGRRESFFHTAVKRLLKSYNPAENGEKQLGSVRGVTTRHMREQAFKSIVGRF